MINKSDGKIRVGVLRGGPSSEYHVSLKTGAAVLKHLPEDKYVPKDIFIDREGAWHFEGVARDPHKILQGVDVAFVALHGEYGEDGKVQKLLEHFHIPYTGSNSLASSLGMNKIASKQIFNRANIKTPFHKVVREEGINPSVLFDIYDEFKSYCVVKPSGTGSSVGVSIVRGGFSSFKKAVEKALVYSPAVLIEEYIKGREATCGVLDSARDRSTYSLLPIEIIKPEGSEFFDYNAKYNDTRTQEICPGDFNDEEREEIQRLAFKAHKSLGLRHYSRSDFIVNSDGIYILETNTLPGLAPVCLIPKSLSASGCEFHEFLDHLIVLALRDHRRN
jgi:D-alanine-D-alanine ligase